MSALDSVFKLCEEGHMVHDSILGDARAELAQLRWRVAMLEVLEGDDGLIAANRLMELCERGDIQQQLSPDIQMARNEIVALRATVAEQARQLAESQNILHLAIEFRKAQLAFKEGIIKQFDTFYSKTPYTYQPDRIAFISAEKKFIESIDAWLAANPAPAPQEDDKQ